MKEITRHRYRPPGGGIPTEDHLTAEEAAQKFPGWLPWKFSLRVERIAEPGDKVAPMPVSLHSMVSPTWRKMGE